MRTSARNYFENLNELRLSYNNITRFDCKIYFTEKTKSLNLLFLDHNYIRVITNSSLKFLIYLEELYLNSNEINLIEANAFNNFNHLEILRLDDNKIEELDESMFHSLFKLKYLNLGSNCLRCVKTHFFSKLFNLIDLDLSNNNLLIIEPYSMTSMDKLKNIYLNGNNNLNLNEQSLIGLKSIENIYIDYEILVNETNKLRLINSIDFVITRVIMRKTYFKSIYITSNFTSPNVLDECFSILFFSKHNIFLNFKTEYDLTEFFRKCDKINLKA